MTTRKKDKAIAAQATSVTKMADVNAIKVPEAAKTLETQEVDDIAVVAVPIVGMGASAGGLAAFETFFSAMPPDSDPGMAFVLVQHLDPNHKSILSELIQRYTRMKVFEVEDGMKVQANCAYIIPPNRDMAFLDGALQLLEPTAPRGQRLPIDFLFRSLAADQHERAIGIVLSGTGSDGTLGVRAIKGEGGMVMAQSPGSTEFDGMPRSALATGMVDYELTPAEMPARLIAYAAHAFSHRARPTTPTAPKIEYELKKIFILLRAQTGHDFSQYKPSTIHRRIERRMALHQVDAMDGYVRFLQQTPDEVEALFRDLLIGVTNFFRDPEAFLALEKQVIPKLFEGKSAGAAIRIWSTGCSTGEEAYSLAILLQERMQALKQTYKVQIFATDIDNRAIATARAGFYPASISADISPERLAQFFTAESDGSAYRIRKSIRDMLVFSEQDIIKDPPFSKLDLLCCRNLLIYLTGDLQKKLISMFHYTLNPGGMLFLGTAETVGEFASLFSPLDSKMKLYRRKEDFHGAQRAALDRFLPRAPVPEKTFPYAAQKTNAAVKLSLREATEQALLKEVALAGVLVNGQGEILYLHGRTGMYLEPAQGEAGINNILTMAREGLRRELTMALHKAVITKQLVRMSGLRVKTNGHFTTVNLSIRPVLAGAAQTSESMLYAVILEEVTVLSSSNAAIENAGSAQQSDLSVRSGSAETDAPHTLTNTFIGVSSASDEDRRSSAATIAALNEELRTNKEHLHATNEELETSNEELKSSNEEMQSVNEELQSTNEELETSKEEMQSVNEELSTVNAELQTKVTDLSRTSNDLSNLLASTGIGTVFVDHQLRIQRFTPTITRIINLIPSDEGRPVANIVSNLVNYSQLVADTQSVLNTLVAKEMEVQTTENNWYTMRIMPYRTLDNVIEGAVITFVEITEVVRTREALRKANQLLRLAVVVRDAYDAITVQDLTGRILAWNPGAVRMYGWSEDEALSMNANERIPQGLRETELFKVHQLSQDKTQGPYLTQRVTKSGEVVEVSITSNALVSEAGHIYAIATTERMREFSSGRVPEAHDNGPG